MSHDDKVLQRICEEVARDPAFFGHTIPPSKFLTFGQAVARRYATTAIERAFKDVYAHGATGYIGDEDDDEDMSEAQSDAWEQYPKRPASPST